jgi:AAA+ ATPase superfamily predicted ATPase
MKTKAIKQNPHFIGRRRELARLNAITNQNVASIIVVHGRRRVGKTELIEQFYRDRHLLKFEGVEGQNTAYQQRLFLRQLAEYVGDAAIAALSFSSWLEIFQYTARYVTQGTWTLFFEEVQWLACYEDTFVSELKYAWDNYFRYNDKLILVLCGSSPSFMIGKVLKSSALYNRSMHELPLEQFSLDETRQFLDGKYDHQEVMDAYLSVGGIPEYLKFLKTDSSVLLALCKSLASNKHYATIVEYLSKRRHATRTQIAARLEIETGGSLTALLTDLELCGFIERFTPFNLGENAKLARYAVRDRYLQFYYKFIDAKRGEIARGAFDRNPTAALASDTYYIWLGYAFERYCRANAHKLAQMLGFGAVGFHAGAFYNRATEKEDADYQIDLVFERNDRVFTLCEIKYLRGPASKKIIQEFEKKLDLFANPLKRSIQKVLIAAHGAETSVANSGYFDHILTLEDIFAMD